MTKTHEPTDRRTLKFRVYRRIAVSFLLGTTALLAIVIYFSLGKAVISITPRVSTVPVELLIPLRPDVAPRPDEPLIQGTISETIAEESEPVIAKEFTEVPGFASGKVTLVNVSARTQPLIATTRLLTPDNILFRIQKDVVVPANGAVSVEARADKKGIEGNVGPTSFTIPGLSSSRQREVFAKIETSMTGGIVRDLAVTPEQIETAKKHLDEKLLTNGSAYHPATLSLETIEESESETETSEGVGKLLTKKARVRGANFDEQRLFDLLRERVGQSMPRNHAMHRLDYNSLTLSIVESNPDGSGLLKARMIATTIIDKNTPSLKSEQFVNLEPERIIESLQQLPDIESVAVRLFPFWSRRAPQFAENIEIRIEKPKIDE